MIPDGIGVLIVVRAWGSPGHPGGEGGFAMPRRQVTPARNVQAQADGVR